MIDMRAISATLSTIEVASKYFKNYLTQIKDTAIRQKLGGLLDAIIPLQTHIISLQAENEMLEKKLREKEEWKTETLKYELKELVSGVFAYKYKPDTNCSAPIHYLCSNCFDTKRQKSILQRQQDKFGTYYICNNCGSKIFDHFNPPSFEIETSTIPLI